MNDDFPMGINLESDDLQVAVSTPIQAPIEPQKDLHRSEDGTLSVAYCGQIENQDTIRSQITAQGHPLAGSDPASLLLAGYRLWGKELPRFVEGTCSFILWDSRNRRLLMARDRIGFGQIYYALVDESPLAAFSVSALRNRLTSLEPDISSLAYALSIGYVPAPHSIWKHLRRLEPSECMEWRPGEGFRQHRYWQLPDAIHSPKVDWAELFDRVVAEIVSGDRQLGLLLSSGLDSSSIALAVKRSGQRITTMSLKTPGSDETSLARELADHLGFPMVEVAALTMGDCDALMNEVAAVFEEPQCHLAVLTSYRLKQQASRHFSAILTGDGAEEVLGGYPWYGNVDRRGDLRSWLRSKVRSGRRALSPVERFARRSDLHRHLYRLRPTLALPEHLQALMPDHLRGFDEATMLAPLSRHFLENLPLRRACQRLDLATFCPEAQLPKIHQTAGAFGLGLALPFLSREVAEWGLSRPVDAAESVERKPVLKNYLRHHVPDKIVNLPKHGLNPTWIKELPPLDVALDEIRTSYWVRNGYWSGKIESFVQPGTLHWRHRLFSLTFLSRWAECWLK